MNPRRPRLFKASIDPRRAPNTGATEKTNVPAGILHPRGARSSPTLQAAPTKNHQHQGISAKTNSRCRGRAVFLRTRGTRGEVTRQHPSPARSTVPSPALAACRGSSPALPASPRTVRQKLSERTRPGILHVPSRATPCAPGQYRLREALSKINETLLVRGSDGLGNKGALLRGHHACPQGWLLQARPRIGAQATEE